MRRNFALKGQFKNSFPQIWFVYFHPILSQNTPQFILKRNPSVMFLLAGDIFPNRRNMTRTHPEQPVPILPMEVAKIKKFPLQPFGRFLFDSLQYFGRWMLFGQITKDVDVIVVTVNQHIATAFVPQDGGHVSEEFGADFVA